MKVGIFNIGNEIVCICNWLLKSVLEPKQLQLCADNDIKIQPLRTNNGTESTARRQPKWEREETVVLVAEYFRTRDLSKTEQEKSIEFVSKLLRMKAKQLGLIIDKTYRNITGIEMKNANIKSLDILSISEGKVGLKNASELDKNIVDEYYESQERINQEAYLIIMRYLEL